MNYKTLFAWLVAGGLAYTAGISANIGIIIFSGFSSLFFLLLGIARLADYCSEEKPKLPARPVFDEIETDDGFWYTHNSPVKLPKEKKVSQKKHRKNTKRLTWRIKVGDRVSITMVDPTEDVPRGKYYGKKGVVEEVRKHKAYRQKVLGVWCRARMIRTSGRQIGSKFPGGYKKHV